MTEQKKIRSRMDGKRLFMTIAVILAGLLFLSGAYSFGRSWQATNALRTSDNFEKVWAHRVNSTGKLRLAGKVFSGVEIDVVFQGGSNTFDVNHPPAESINLSLDEYLSAASEVSGSLQLWLDLKNLNDENREQVLSRLEYLVEKYGLGDRFMVVESRNHMSLRHLAQNGIYTSYYVPSMDIDGMSGVEKKAAADALIQNARLAEVRAISFPGRMYGFVKEHMQEQLDGLEMLTWFTSKRIDEHDDAVFLEELVRDRDLRVVLVRYAKESEFHR
jgi:hypothetical protein